MKNGERKNKIGLISKIAFPRKASVNLDITEEPVVWVEKDADMIGLRKQQGCLVT